MQLWNSFALQHKPSFRIQKWPQTTNTKNIFVRLMGLCPSSVKTAPRKPATRLFMITEQVIYICIFSNVFDASSDFFGRLLFKLLHATWYATHTSSPLGHHQSRLKSDEGKKGEGEEGEGEMKEGILYTANQNKHKNSKRRPCFDQSSDLNPSSKAPLSWSPVI